MPALITGAPRRLVLPVTDTTGNCNYALIRVTRDTVRRFKVRAAQLKLLQLTDSELYAMEFWCGADESASFCLSRAVLQLDDDPRIDIDKLSEGQGVVLPDGLTTLVGLDHPTVCHTTYLTVHTGRSSSSRPHVCWRANYKNSDVELSTAAVSINNLEDILHMDLISANYIPTD